MGKHSGETEREAILREAREGGRTVDADGYRAGDESDRRRGGGEAGDQAGGREAE